MTRPKMESDFKSRLRTQPNPPLPLSGPVLTFPEAN